MSANLTTTNKHSSRDKKHKRLDRLSVKDSSFTKRYSFLHCKTWKQSCLNKVQDHTNA